MTPSITRAAALALALAAAGLLVGASASEQPAPAQPAPAMSNDVMLVSVQLYEFAYTPGAIDLQSGRKYIMRVSNDGNSAHDLSAKAFFQTVAFAPDSADKVHDGKIELAKGASVDVAFTAGAAGTYEMHCTHPLHSMMGMKGKVVVH